MNPMTPPIKSAVIMILKVFFRPKNKDMTLNSLMSPAPRAFNLQGNSNAITIMHMHNNALTTPDGPAMQQLYTRPAIRNRTIKALGIRNVRKSKMTAADTKPSTTHSIRNPSAR